MPATSAPRHDKFAWEIQPAAAARVAGFVAKFVERSSTVARLSQLLREETGTRLVDWIDHLSLVEANHTDGAAQLAAKLEAVGYLPASDDREDVNLWRHPLGMFPPLRLDAAHDGLAIRVDSVEDALARLRQSLGLAKQSDGAASISGERGGPFRQTLLDDSGGVHLWLIERHGFPHFHVPGVTQAEIDAAKKQLAVFRDRQRAFDALEDGFRHASKLFAAAEAEIGRDWACDLFFYGEREYWQGRNRAGRVQFERQNRLGLGWSNHDHHTYRSSRLAFRHLIAVLEQMGFECRERFYAGREAGWGAKCWNSGTAAS